jgi:hypothetical protein
MYNKQSWGFSVQPTSIISLLDGSDNIQASVNLKRVRFDAAVCAILNDIANHVSGLENLLKSSDDFYSQCGKPVLAKISGHTGSGNFESYWALYISGCCLVFFDEPSSISEWNRIYEWAGNTEFSLVGEDEEINPIEEDNDFTVLQEEFLKYACWEDGLLYTSIDLEERMTTADKDEGLGLYIFDPDSFYDYDIISEISSVWPLKFKA